MSERMALGDWEANVERWPGEASRPVLCLHGFTAHGASWDHLARSLQPDHEVAALDQRGHGASGPTERYGSRPMVDDVGAVLDHLGWARADLVGQSMGGVNAFVFAAAHPERVRRLVVVDIGPEHSPAGLARIRANVGDRPDSFASLDDALVEGRRSFPQADEALLRWRIEHNLVATADGRLTWRTAPELRTGTAARDDHSVEERWAAWAAVSAPTLLVRGGDSDILSVEIAERMVAARSDVRLVTIEGATHAVPLDRPVELAAAVRAFLDEERP